MRLQGAQTTSTAHHPVLRAPYYAAPDLLPGASAYQPQIHEYRGADFMQHFVTDLRKETLTASVRQTWFGRNKLDGRQQPTLRQSVHDGHYMVCCELTCGGRQRAPLDPRRVIQAWLTIAPYADADKTATGGLMSLIRVAMTGDGDKLLTRRAANRDGRLEVPLRAAMQRLQAQVEGSAGGGQPVNFPLRPELIADGRGTRHTLLTGLLPVTEALGQIGRREPNVLHDAAAQDASASTLAERFGNESQPVADDSMLWDGSSLDSRLAALVQLLDENLAIGVVAGELAFTAAISTGETQIGDTPIASWKEWLANAFFYVLPATAPNNQFVAAQQACATAHGRARANLQPAFVPPGASQALRDAVKALFDALRENDVPRRTDPVLSFTRLNDYSPRRIQQLSGPWRHYTATLLPRVEAAIRRVTSVPVSVLSQLEPLRRRLHEYRDALRAVDGAASSLAQQFADPLRHRRQSLLQWFTRERGATDQALVDQLPDDRRLIVTADWINQGPGMIRARWLTLIRQLAEEWSGTGLDETSGNDDQLYRIKVHARVRGEHGCEYLVHSEFSEPFHIASFYETRLMPPRPIRMPSLKDLKKAVAGPAMVLPEDTAAAVSRLRFPDGKVESSGAGTAGRWIYVFSIPIVTLCAMILLMLMITILDFIFRWIPYAILRIPIPGRSPE